MAARGRGPRKTGRAASPGSSCWPGTSSGRGRSTTSPLVRAVQTAEIVAQALEIDDVEVLEELRPDVPVQAVLERSAQFDGKRMGLVGHDPQMTGLVAALSGQPPDRLRFPKGAVVRFDVSDLARRQAQARWWLAPREKEVNEGLPVRGEGGD